MEQFVTDLVDVLPQWLRNVAELAIYFALLTALMIVPLVLWLVYAVASTMRAESRRSKQAPAARASSA